MKGRNNTIFLKTNKSLDAIGKQLGNIASILERKNNVENKDA